MPEEPQQRELTYGLLKQFEKQQGCDRYSADTQRIKLLSDYIWLRRLAPNLTFEEFLTRYTPVADFDDENLKHPDDAIKMRCPRSKSQAEKLKVSQWSATEVVDMLVLYVDMCREADAAAIDVPIELEEFLRLDGPRYKEGQIAGPDKPAAVRGPGRRSGQSQEPTPADPTTGIPPSGNPLRPTQAGQRVIYAMPSQGGRQIKGVTVDIHTEGDRSYCDFQSDDGEVVQGANICHFTLCDEAPPSPPQLAEPKQKVWIPKSQYPQVVGALGLNTRLGNVELDEAIYQWSAQFACGMIADITVVNGQNGPYVDACLVDPSKPENAQVVVELPPRSEVLGDYRFPLPDDAGTLELEVSARQ